MEVAKVTRGQWSDHLGGCWCVWMPSLPSCHQSGHLGEQEEQMLKRSIFGLHKKNSLQSLLPYVINHHRNLATKMNWMNLTDYISYMSQKHESTNCNLFQLYCCEFSMCNMNVRIQKLCMIACMCIQTQSWFINSSKRVEDSHPCKDQVTDSSPIPPPNEVTTASHQKKTPAGFLPVSLCSPPSLPVTTTTNNNWPLREKEESCMLRPPPRVGGRLWMAGSEVEVAGVSTTFMMASSCTLTTGPEYGSRSTGSGCRACSTRGYAQVCRY